MFELMGNDQYYHMGKILLFSLGFLLALTFLAQRLKPSLRQGFIVVKSWCFLAPIIYFSISLAAPYPLIILTFLSLYGAKNFFQMTGMYHRTNFVLVCYLGILASSYCIHQGWYSLNAHLPVLVLFFSCLIPMARNSYKNMVQLMALTLLNYCFLWAFLHLGLLIERPAGPFLVLFIIILTEFFDTIYLAFSKRFRRIRIVHKITPKRSLEGFIISALLTLGLGFLLKDLLGLPNYWRWGGISLLCCLFASTGDTVLAVVRRDLGIKVTEGFIFGRGDFFSHLDRFVFVAPMVFYWLVILEVLGL